MKEWQKEKMKIWKKKAKWALATLFSFTQYTKPTWRRAQNLKTLVPIGAEKFPLEGKKNEQIKGLIRICGCLFVVVFCYNSSLSSFVPNFRSCWEIFDRVKGYKHTSKQTNVVTENAKTIYPLYTSYRGIKDHNFTQKNDWRILKFFWLYTIWESSFLTKYFRIW